MPVELNGTEHQPHARLVLGKSLTSLADSKGEGRSTLSHAYLFQGPPGAGKREAARAFAAEILTLGRADSDEIKRRSLAGVHPDLAWIEPRGAHGILVSDIRDRLIAAIWRRPFEAARSVYVVEQAELMNRESANALLKTLEEPPPYAHIVLISNVPGRLPETVRSRCQSVRFGSLPWRLVAEKLVADGVSQARAEACARISAGDASLARELAAESGDQVRDAGKKLVSCLDDVEGKFERPWLDMLSLADQAGSQAESEAKSNIDAVLELYPKGRERQRVKRELEQTASRQKKRQMTTVLDLQLKLSQYLLRDLVALEKGATGLILNVDMKEWLSAHAKSDTASYLDAIEACEETRRHLRQNVVAEMALEALFYRVEAALS